MSRRKKKPQVPFGSIYQRGKNYYFENRKKGIKPTSLKTDDPDEAVDKANELFGYLQFRDEARQQQQILQRIQSNNENGQRVEISTVALVDIEDEYSRALKRVGKSKGHRHIDATKECPLSPTTVYSTVCVVRQFRKWIARVAPGTEFMHEITPALADRYFDKLREKRTAKTYTNHLSSLEVVRDRLSIRAGISTNPFSKIQNLPKNTLDHEKVSKRPFSLEQLQTIFEKSRGTKWEPIVRLAYETGLRLGDICCLEEQDIDMEGGFLDLRTKRTRKSGKAHIFYIPASMPYLKEWMKRGEHDDSHLFPGLARSYVGGRGRNAATNQFTYFLQQNCDISTKVEVDGDARSALGFHSFRVSRATYARSRGQSVKEVQDALGHTDQKTTEGYIQESNASIKQRLVAEHRALPLAGASSVDMLFDLIHDAWQKLDDSERWELADRLGEAGLTDRAKSREEPARREKRGA